MFGQVGFEGGMRAVFFGLALATGFAACAVDEKLEDTAGSSWAEDKAARGSGSGSSPCRCDDGTQPYPQNCSVCTSYNGGTCAASSCPSNQVPYCSAPQDRPSYIESGCKTPA
jgi:hypothetical protein